MMTKLVKAPPSLAILWIAVAATPAFAQNNSTEPADGSGLDEVIVTGTRAAERTVFETLAPVDLLTDAAIESSISSDLTDVLAQLVPSYNVQRLPMADGQVFVRPATLRSLSPDQTLVLLNGKRFHRSALLGIARIARRAGAGLVANSDQRHRTCRGAA
jgi:iron complex outermembrane receptor protein